MESASQPQVSAEAAEPDYFEPIPYPQLNEQIVDFILGL
jgi:hypothetical protein